MPILDVRGLEKYYGRRKVVDGVNFDVDAGEIVGLLGPNGAGKTTSFRMTTGQITPEGGRVMFAGQDVTVLPMFRRARLGMGYLSQETSVFRKLSVEQNILAILEAMPVCRSLGRSLSRSERWERTDKILDQFGLNQVRKNNAARLSGGEKRRLEIARCLVCEPLLILLDEPFTGIDPKTIADIQQIVSKLRDEGIGILLTDHNVRETLRITDRSYLIYKGKVIASGTPREVVADEKAKEIYFGNAFDDDYLGGSAKKPESGRPAALGTSSLLHQEKIRRLVEQLKSDDPDTAMDGIVQFGEGAFPALLEALERRDFDMRCLALAALQKILKSPLTFDPNGPDPIRRKQIAEIKQRFDRKAG